MQRRSASSASEQTSPLTQRGQKRVSSRTAGRKWVRKSRPCSSASSHAPLTRRRPPASPSSATGSCALTPMAAQTDRNPPIRGPPPSTRMPYGTCGTKMSTVLSSASVSVQMHAWGRIRISASSAVFPETGASSLPTASQAAEGWENSSSMRSISPVIRRNGIFPSDV